eukprot:COSAG02_NODE_42410_length_384_cov_49.357895_2_plen_37_part_01
MIGNSALLLCHSDWELSNQHRIAEYTYFNVSGMFKSP